ncbi:MAG: aminoacyl-tRNA hydrolase [Pirellulaceae bacterium]
MSGATESLKLVVGLGNPGRKYENTRHNIGFDVIDELGRRLSVGASSSKFEGEIATGQFQGQKVALIRPLTFMNLSGRCVAAFVKFYKIDPSKHLLVACDDLSLPFAKLRFRARGSAGGQNGLKDIIRAIGTQEFCRLRFGIGQPPPQWDAADYVLGKFNGDEKEQLAGEITNVCNAVECWLKSDIDECMNRFN